MAANKIAETGYGAQQRAWLLDPPVATVEVIEDEENDVEEVAALVVR
jgi:hypothetical protein